ncbi:MAG: hypothetical protein IPL79_13050 [Myxococcales bacterium]|nr:hypothetical protein [Myxococcales bacterium]
MIGQAKQYRFSMVVRGAAIGRLGVIAMLLAGSPHGCYRDPDANSPSPDAGTDGSNDGPDGSCEDSCSDDNTLLTCPNTPVDCDLGCSETGGAHCKEMLFSNQLNTVIVAGVGDVNLTCTGVLSFEATGRIMHGGLELRPAGDGLDVVSGIGFDKSLAVPVFSMNSVVLKNCTIQTADLRAFGIAVRHDFSFANGVVRGEGNGTSQDNPAGGCGPGGTLAGGAGGGAGGGTNGGKGSGSGGTGGAGGLTCPSMHVPLMPGSGGGVGLAPLVNAAYGQGGRGGLALQISAFGNMTIEDTLFRFGGAGGGKGKDGNPAGGGGSGGTVFLEARNLVVTNSELYANGGNGGFLESDGASGINSVGPSANVGGEGRGGTVGNAPGDGTFQTAYTGGGGAVGQLRFHGFSVDTTGTVNSPGIVASEPPVE